jgi:hypothetical protein
LNGLAKIGAIDISGWDVKRTLLNDKVLGDDPIVLKKKSCGRRVGKIEGNKFSTLFPDLLKFR